MKKEFKTRILSSLILLPLVLFFIIKGSYYFNFLIFICLLISIYEWHLMSKKKPLYIFGFFFIFFSFYTAFLLRNNYEGYSTFMSILIICISTDVGGYIFGKIFKGPKLTKISPKKTYAGMIGGFFLSIISVNLYFIFNDFNVLNQPTYSSLNTLILIVIISCISQLGDISISYFKRRSKIKNTGKLIPGHGGILDRIDGMIFAFPSTFLILKMIQ